MITRKCKTVGGMSVLYTVDVEDGIAHVAVDEVSVLGEPVDLSTGRESILQAELTKIEENRPGRLGLISALDRLGFDESVTYGMKEMWGEI